jgi:hypothetical protein
MADGPVLLLYADLGRETQLRRFAQLSLIERSPAVEIPSPDQHGEYGLPGVFIPGSGAVL